MDNDGIRIRELTAYTFQDVMYWTAAHVSTVEFREMLPYNEKLLTFSKICATLGCKIPTGKDNAYTQELFEEMYARYFDEVVCVIYDDEITDDTPRDYFYAKKLSSIVSLMSRTYDYYVALLGYYKDAEGKLMDDLTSIYTNKTGFNDTPQNDNSTGVYEGDDYLSTFTKNESQTTVPGATKILRLQEVQRLYKRIMDDWVREFDGFFTEVSNFE